MTGKPLMKPNGTRVVVIGSAIALALAGFGLFSYSIFRPSSQPSTAQTPPTPIPDQPDAVSALGRLEPQGGVLKVAAPASIGSAGARVERLLVKEGTAVKENQPIAVLDSYSSLLASAIQAEAQVKEAQSKLEQVKAGAKQGEIQAKIAAVNSLRAELEGEVKTQEARLLKLEAELRNAAEEFKRNEALYKEGGISASALGTKQLTLRTSEQLFEEAKRSLNQRQAQLVAKINEAEATVAQVAEVRPTDIQNAEAQVQVAVANLQKAKAELDKSVVRSPAEGQVLKVHAEPGEVIGAEGILDLGRTNQMYAVAEVDENLINRVKVGQKAKVTGYAFPGEISGVVDFVGLQVRKNDVLNIDPVDRTDTRVVEVKVRLDNSKFVTGLTNLQVKVEIES
jgi:HlyD family secretion protein